MPDLLPHPQNIRDRLTTMTNTQEAFAEGIKYLLQKNAFSQARLAKLAGVNRAYLSRVLSLQQQASDRVKDALAKGMGKETTEVINLGQGVIEKRETNQKNTTEESKVETQEDGNDISLFFDNTKKEIDKDLSETTLLCNRLRLFRELHDLNIKEISKITGTNERNIYNYEEGKRKISVEYLSNLRKKLDLNINWLITDNGPPYDVFSTRKLIGYIKRDFLKVQELRFAVPEIHYIEPEVLFIDSSVRSLAGMLLFEKEHIPSAIELLREISAWANGICSDDYDDQYIDFDEDGPQLMQNPELDSFLGKCASLVTSCQMALDVLKLIC